MRPFLLITSRAEDTLATAEYRAFLRCGRLQESQLEHVRIEAAPLPPIHLDAYSGILLGGSPFTSTDPQDLKPAVQRRAEAEISQLLDQVVPQDFPFLGACYGVGTLAAHQGGLIDSTYAEPAGSVTISLTDEGAQDPVLAGIPRNFEAFVGHKEACSRLPRGAKLLATSRDCPVQMFRIRHNLYGTQFHPELDVEGFIERIETYRHLGYFHPDEVDAIARDARRVIIDAAHSVIENFVKRYARA